MLCMVLSLSLSNSFSTTLYECPYLFFRLMCLCLISSCPLCRDLNSGENFVAFFKWSFCWCFTVTCYPFTTPVISPGFVWVSNAWHCGSQGSGSGPSLSGRDNLHTCSPPALCPWELSWLASTSTCLAVYSHLYLPECRWTQQKTGRWTTWIFTYAGLKAQHSHGLVSQRHISVCCRSPQLSQVVLFLFQGVSLLQ